MSNRQKHGRLARSTRCALVALVIASNVSAVRAAGIAEAFKDLDSEVRASIVKELIKSRSYDVEYTHRRPKDKTSSEKEDSNATDKDRAQKGLDRLKEAMGDSDDAYDRPSRTTQCNMEVASQKHEPGKPTPRRTVVLITEPIMQICK
jgi:hypothetical protein